MQEEHRSPDIPSLLWLAVSPTADLTSPHRVNGPARVVPAEPSSASDKTEFAWSYVVLVSVFAILGCGTVLILVLRAGVPTPDAIQYVLLLLGGVVVIVAATRFGLLRRLGNLLRRLGKAVVAFCTEGGPRQ